MEIAHKNLPSYLYILRCADDGIYIGIATDIKKRLQEHFVGHGSSYTKLKTFVF
jgi:predicted GIY-YIG superfamily endonuclease